MQNLHKLINKESLDRFKKVYTNNILQTIDDIDAISFWYGENLLLGNNIVSPKDYLHELSKISLEDLQKNAQEIFTKPHNIENIE